MEEAERKCSFCTRGPESYHKILTSKATQVSICDNCVIIAMETWFRESPKVSDPAEVEALKQQNIAFGNIISNIDLIIQGRKIST